MANQGSRTVSVIAVATHAVLATVPIAYPGFPQFVAIAPDGAHAYVTTNNTNTVSVIDTNPSSPTFHTVVATVGVGATPWGVAITPFPSAVNEPPVADAGPDQLVDCTSVAGTQVALDGSGSSDPDNDALTYTWTGPFPEGSGTVTGVSPTVTLPLGASTITLVVNDGTENSAPDTVQITVALHVEGLQPPLEPLVPAGDPVLVPDKASKLGRTLPLKLQLFCGGLALTDADIAPPRIVGLVRLGDAPLDLEAIDPDAGTANDSGLLFRYAAPNWVYNLNTKSLAAGTYTITIQMPDGLNYTAAFVLK